MSHDHYPYSDGIGCPICKDDFCGEELHDDKQRGLYRKYHVERVNDPDGKHRDCEYFVLDLVHDKFAAAALRAYADACASEYPALAAGLRAEHFGAERLNAKARGES